MVNSWFCVDKVGLSQLTEGENKGRLIAELVQNALDEPITSVEVMLSPVAGRPLVVVTVEDDSPEGFKDLSHAFTLFASSYKKEDPTKRGRFNLGEKLVLSICDEASIATTTGTVEFGPSGRRVRPRAKRQAGSRFTGTLRMSREEMQQSLQLLRQILKPANVRISINGEELLDLTPVEVFEVSLTTHVADSAGVLRTRQRKTVVEVYEPLPGGEAMLYELGLPVVATGDRWSINVLQKVPLNKDRDNVPPTYLNQLRVEVLNRMHQHLTPEDANSDWGTAASSHSDCSQEAITAYMDLKFGENRAAYAPSDPESAKQVVARGGTVVHSRMLNKQQWNNARTAGAIKSSAELYPSPTPYAEDSDAPTEEVIPPAEWTTAMQAGVAYAECLANELMGVPISVKITRAGHNFAACYGHGRLTFNLAVLGDAWFESASGEEIDALLLHEFGHQYSSDHLSEEYYDALCMLGAKLKQLALHKPALLRQMDAKRSAPPSDTLAPLV